MNAFISPEFESHIVYQDQSVDSKMKRIFITLLLSPSVSSNFVGREGEDARADATASFNLSGLQGDRFVKSHFRLLL